MCNRTCESIESIREIIVRKFRRGILAMDKEALAGVFSGPVLLRSGLVAVIVGSILNTINQGDVILSGGAPEIWKIALTFCVPFFVASYGAYSALSLCEK